MVSYVTPRLFPPLPSCFPSFPLLFPLLPFLFPLFPLLRPSPGLSKRRSPATCLLPPASSSSSCLLPPPHASCLLFELSQPSYSASLPPLTNSPIYGMYGPWPRLCPENLLVHNATYSPAVETLARLISVLEQNEKYFEDTTLSLLLALPPPTDPRQEIPACYIDVTKGGFNGGFSSWGKLGPLSIRIGQALSGHATLATGN